MKPLVGLIKAKTLSRFETEDQGVKVLVTDLPGEALWRGRQCVQGQSRRHRRHQPESIDTPAGLAIIRSRTPRTARPLRRYSMILPGPTFSGYVAMQVPENASKIYTDDAVRQCLRRGDPK